MKSINVRTNLRAGIANPASEFCEQQGGKLIIVSGKDSEGEFGICQFPDNDAFEEWSYFHLCTPRGK